MLLLHEFCCCFPNHSYLKHADPLGIHIGLIVTFVEFETSVACWLSFFLLVATLSQHLISPCLAQWFSKGEILFPKEQLAVSGDILVVPIDICWVGARDAMLLSLLQGTGLPTQH